MSRTFSALTFDCYGTLIDWEMGILHACRQIFGDEISADRDELLRLYSRHEREVQSGPYMPYREVLAEVARRLALDLAVPLSAGGDRALAESLPSWPAFDETPTVLARLKRRYKLAVLSNIDDELFDAPGGSRDRIGVALDAFVSAEHVRSYKPGLAHFHEGLRRLNLAPDHVLHVAESRYHDVAPARSLGIATVWVNRRSLRPGASASGESDAKPDIEVPNLAALAEYLGV